MRAGARYVERYGRTGGPSVARSTSCPGKCRVCGTAVQRGDAALYVPWSVLGASHAFCGFWTADERQLLAMAGRERGVAFGIRSDGYATLFPLVAAGFVAMAAPNGWTDDAPRVFTLTTDGRRTLAAVAPDADGAA